MPPFEQCYFFKARRNAQDAQMLIVNHHLLFADLIKRLDQRSNSQESSILPYYKRVILDEAHHIEEIATDYFANRLHRMELIRLISKLAADKHGSSMGKLPLLKEKIQMAFNRSATKDAGQIIVRLAIDLPASRQQLHEQVHTAFDSFARFIEKMAPPTAKWNEAQGESIPIEQKFRLLKTHQSHPIWIEEVMPQARKLADMLNSYINSLRSIETDLKLIQSDHLNDQTKGVRFDIQALVFRLETAVGILNDFLNESKDSSKVKWIEVHTLRLLMNVHLVDAELDVPKRWSISCSLNSPQLSSAAQPSPRIDNFSL